MRYRRLASTGLEVSVIGLGTWQFKTEWGKQFSQTDVDDFISRAGELGVNLIDTAERYGDHLAESLVATPSHLDPQEVEAKLEAVAQINSSPTPPPPTSTSFPTRIRSR